MQLKATVLMVAVAAMVATASAGIVIDYDNATFGSGDLGSPTAVEVSDLNSDGQDDATGWVKGNKDVTAEIPLGGSYTGPTMYGVIRMTRLNSTGTSFDNRDGTPVDVRMQGDDEAINWLMYFQADTAVTLGTDSYIAFAGDGTETGESVGRTESQDFRRWVVMDQNGVFYVSDVAFGGGTDSATLTADELFGLNGETAVNWAVADFANELDQDLSALTYDVSATDLNGIGLKGFGMYLGEEGLDEGVSNRFWFGFSDFTVDAVPEPATMSLLAIGGLAGLLRRRRR